MKKNCTIGILIVLVIIVCLLIGGLEEIHWGKGKCHECEAGTMELWDTERYYIYRCNACGNIEKYTTER